MRLLRYARNSGVPCSLWSLSMTQGRETLGQCQIVKHIFWKLF